MADEMIALLMPCSVRLGRLRAPHAYCSLRGPLPLRPLRRTMPSQLSCRIQAEPNRFDFQLLLTTVIRGLTSHGSELPVRIHFGPPTSLRLVADLCVETRIGPQLAGLRPCCAASRHRARRPVLSSPRNFFRAALSLKTGTAARGGGPDRRAQRRPRAQGSRTARVRTRRCVCGLVHRLESPPLELRSR